MDPQKMTDQELTDTIQEALDNQNRILASETPITDADKFRQQTDELRQYERLEFVCRQEQKRRESIVLEQQIQAKGYTIKDEGPFLTTVSNGVECIELYRPMYLEELRKVVQQIDI